MKAILLTVLLLTAVSISFSTHKGAQPAPRRPSRPVRPRKAMRPSRA
jgi:hypothetical protein